MFVFSPDYSAMAWHPDQRAGAARRLLQDLPAWLDKVEADSVCVTGTSGEALGFPLAAMPVAPRIFVVHKPVEARAKAHHGDFAAIHSTAWQERGNQVHRVALLDDFVSSGSTVRRVYDQLKAHDAELVAVITYQRLRGDTKGVRLQEGFGVRHGENNEVRIPVWGYDG